MHAVRPRARGPRPRRRRVARAYRRYELRISARPPWSRRSWSDEGNSVPKVRSAVKFWIVPRNEAVRHRDDHVVGRHDDRAEHADRVDRARDAGSRDGVAHVKGRKNTSITPEEFDSEP